MSIRLIATDLDGTLLNNESALSDYTQEVLHRAAASGMTIAVATGRAFYAMPDCITQNGDIRYAVTSNGSAVYDLQNGTLLYNRVLSPASVQALADFALTHKLGLELICGGYAYGEKYYFDHPETFGFDERSVHYLKTTRIKIENFDLFLKEHIETVESVDFVLKDPQMRAEIENTFCKDASLYITSSHPHILEFSAAGGGKGNAVRALLKKEGLTTENLAAFGNADNDFDMLQPAKTGVATANSPNSLKQKVAYTCDACYDDGVAKFIEKHIL